MEAEPRDDLSDPDPDDYLVDYTNEELDDFSAYLVDLDSIGGPPDWIYETAEDDTVFADAAERPVDERGRVELLLLGDVAQAFWSYGPDFKSAPADCCLAYEYRETTDTRHAVIHKELPVLTPEEIEKHRAEVDAATLDEYSEWARLGCFKIRPRRGADNVVDGILVVKWKKDGARKFVRVRLALRGFKDKYKNTVETCRYGIKVEPQGVERCRRAASLAGLERRHQQGLLQGHYVCRTGPEDRRAASVDADGCS